MSSTVFVNGVTLTDADWFNDVNSVAYTLFGNGSAYTGALTLGSSGNITVNTNKFTVAASSGNTVVAGTLSLAGALTYGGVTLGNAVTGTGNMVLSTSPTITTPTISGALTYGGVALSASVTGTGSMVLSASPTLTTPNIGAATGTSLNLSTNSNTTTGVATNNNSNGTLARNGLLATGDAQDGFFGVNSSGYTGVSGWADAGIININNASNGLILGLDGVTKAQVTSAGLAVTGIVTGTALTANGAVAVKTVARTGTEDAQMAAYASNGSTLHGLLNFTANGLEWYDSTPTRRFYITNTSATITASTSVIGGNGDQLYLNNTGQRYTQLHFQNNNTAKADIYWDNDTSTFTIRNIAGSTVAVTGALNTTSYYEGAEQTAPAAPAANGYRIFAQDNGAGKTQLMVIFASGAAQQLAIEP